MAMTEEKRKALIKKIAPVSGPTLEQRQKINAMTGSKPTILADGTTAMDALKGGNPVLAGARAASNLGSKVSAFAKTRVGPGMKDFVAGAKSPATFGMKALDKITNPITNRLVNLIKNRKK